MSDEETAEAVEHCEIAGESRDAKVKWLIDAYETALDDHEAVNDGDNGLGEAYRTILGHLRTLLPCPDCRDTGKVPVEWDEGTETRCTSCSPPTVNEIRPDPKAKARRPDAPALPVLEDQVEAAAALIKRGQRDWYSGWHRDSNSFAVLDDIEAKGRLVASGYKTVAEASHAKWTLLARACLTTLYGEGASGQVSVDRDDLIALIVYYDAGDNEGEYSASVERLRAAVDYTDAEAEGRGGVTEGGPFGLFVYMDEGAAEAAAKHLESFDEAAKQRADEMEDYHADPSPMDPEPIPLARAGWQLRQALDERQRSRDELAPSSKGATDSQKVTRLFPERYSSQDEYERAEWGGDGWG